MKVTEVAKYMGVTRKHVYSLVQKGEIKSHMSKGMHARNHTIGVLVIYKDDVDEYLSKRGVVLDPAACPHLRHSASGRCKGCGEQHQILYVPFDSVTDPRYDFSDHDSPAARLSFAIFSAKVEKLDTSALEARFPATDPFGRTYKQYRADFKASKAKSS